jgi:DNA-binding beta-propeller fold protein YncE
MRSTPKVAVLLVVAAATLGPIAPAPGGLARAGAVSPRAPLFTGQQLAELKGSDTVAGDWFGTSVAVSGSTAMVGAPGHADKAGRAYVFTETATGWQQAAELKGSDTVAGDLFGGDVAVSGATAVVGATRHANYAGRAYVFTKTASGWQQVAELEGSDTVADDLFGWSVAVSGTTVVVGAVGYANYAGRAYVFAKTATGWAQVAELKGSDTVSKDVFGASVAVSGTTVAVGAPGANQSGGHVYVFRKTATGWQQTPELTGGGQFGWSVAVSGTTVVAGANYEASPYKAPDAGMVYVFTFTNALRVFSCPTGFASCRWRTGPGWQQTAEMDGSNTAAKDYFGDSVAVSGTTVVAGAANHASGAGRAYEFAQSATGWHQVSELKGSDTNIAGGNFGWSVGLSGTTVVAGAPDHGPSYAGRAYVFSTTTTTPAPAAAPGPWTAYVTNFDSGTVTPVDLATGTTGKPIKVGSGPDAIAITPDGRTAYVTDMGSGCGATTAVCPPGTVTPLYLATGKVGKPIQVGSGPDAIAITPDSKMAYVANGGGGNGGPQANSVTPVDLATGTTGRPISTVSAATSTTVEAWPRAIAITPDGRTAYVANGLGTTVVPIDLATGTAGAPITVGIDPDAIAITPDGNTAYVANYADDTVTPINLATNVPGPPVQVGPTLGPHNQDLMWHPTAIAITPDGWTAYVTSKWGLVSTVDLTTGVATPAGCTQYGCGPGAIPVPRGPAGAPHPDAIAITPDGRTAYVADPSNGILMPVNLATNTPGKPIVVGSSPHGIVITDVRGPFMTTTASGHDG